MERPEKDRPERDRQGTSDSTDNRYLLEELLSAELRHLRIRNLQAEEDLIAKARATEKHAAEQESGWGGRLNDAPRAYFAGDEPSEQAGIGRDLSQGELKQSNLNQALPNTDPPYGVGLCSPPDLSPLRTDQPRA